MDADEYQRLALRTASPGQSQRDRLIVAALGLAGESGEFVDTIKKWAYHQHVLEVDELRKELGDVLWYVALACDALGLQLGDVMAGNIEKLHRRYPDGFSGERSLNRNDE